MAGSWSGLEERCGSGGRLPSPPQHGLQGRPPHRQMGLPGAELFISAMSRKGISARRTGNWKSVWPSVT